MEWRKEKADVRCRIHLSWMARGWEDLFGRASELGEGWRERKETSEPWRRYSNRR